MAELQRREVSSELGTSRRLTRSIARSARLIITATAMHRGIVIRLDPALAERTFTLKELACAAARARGLDALLAEARAAAAVPAERDDDLADPHGLDQAAYQRMFDEVDVALAVLIPALRGG